MNAQAEPPAPRGQWLRRPWTAALVVLAVYAVLALANADGGYLGTDTGAKVITLDRMVERDTASPDVGYWAEKWDPDGTYHPLFDTRRNEDGEWINVTTLPMLLAARPLYDLGGYDLALLWPMLGALLTAFAARDIARALADDDAGWWTFWVVALASPLTVYALDLWEHSIGAGLMLTAAALLLRTLTRAAPMWLAACAGACLGAAAAMRAEAMVVSLVAVGGTCLVLVSRRDLGRSITTGASAVAGFAVPWFANAWLESALGGNSRASRIGGQAQREWWTELGDRGKEALITWFGMPNASYPQSAVLGVTVVAALVGGIALHRRGDPRRARVAFSLAVALHLLALFQGLGFVSGALVAAPFAAVALLSWRTRTSRELLAAALGATALTWTFQLTGGAVPQWGGRYLLVPTTVLTTIGIAALSGRTEDRRARAAVAGLALVVTAFGVAWLNERSHAVDTFFGDLAERPEDVIVSTNGFFVREAGPAYEGHRYLSVGRRGDVAGAVDVAEDAGATTVGVLGFSATPPDLDAELAGSERLDLLDAPIWYHRYELGVGASR